jgi:hypothetical protein
MIAVKNTRGRAKRDPGVAYAKALETHQRMESELSRAMNRWQKSRKALWRAECKLDKAQAAKWDATTDAIDPELNDDV